MNMSRRTAPDRPYPPLCACGCGKEVTKKSDWPYTWNKYIYGHYTRINNPMKNPEISSKFKGDKNPMRRPEVLAKKSGVNHHYYGKKRSQEVCEKISKTKHENPYKHTEEWKKNNSKRMLSLGPNHPFRNPKVIEENRLRSSILKKGVPLSDEQKKKISDAICSLGEKHWMKRPEHRERAKNFLILVRPDMKGEKSPNWLGGISAEPYPIIWIDSEFKASILRRDNCECQNPDCRKTTEKLCGHHIDYNKKNCDLSNVITVCFSCNTRANTNREYWIKFYREIMSEKYGYKYELDQVG